MKEEALGYLRAALGDDRADFREGQWDAIESLVVGHKRLLVVQRTGWGKSIVYFIATKLLRSRGAGITLLISPLLALMRNQLEAAERIGSRAATINSSNRDEWTEVESRLRRNEIDILLISPERLANDDFRENVLIPLQAGIGLFVIDEAHCISDWGHDFRPDYRRIRGLMRVLPAGVPVLATTATANDRVVADVREQLGAEVEVIRGPLARASLRLQNIRIDGAADRLAWLARRLPDIPGSGIIYTLTVRDANRVAEWLRSQRISAYAYHADLPPDDRPRLEQQLLRNEIKALVATVALGMGFDKPDLGFVIHYQRPSSLVHYYQQVGRAGRALDEAFGILLGGEEDREIVNYFIAAAFPPEGRIDEVLHELDETEEGLKATELEERLNLSRTQIGQVLKVLSSMSPAPVRKVGSRWATTAVPYQADRAKVENITQLRRREQEQLEEYFASRQCLMEFVARALDDPNAERCGRCAVCLERELIPSEIDPSHAANAVEFLRGNPQLIEPRKAWAGTELKRVYGWQGNIKEELQAEPGRSLAIWGDAGWGKLIKRGKQTDFRFDDELVAASVRIVRDRWRPQPPPGWVTAVPSLRNPRLVPDFAERLARELGLPYVAAIRKLRDTPAQKTMQNSSQQTANLAGAFAVDGTLARREPVLLVDDMIDSRWTTTILAALLREAGSGPVFPFALALTSAGAE